VSVFNEEEKKILGYIGKGIAIIIFLPALIFVPIILAIEFLGGE
jgi:hypothetical protein